MIGWEKIYIFDAKPNSKINELEKYLAGDARIYFMVTNFYRVNNVNRNQMNFFCSPLVCGYEETRREIEREYCWSDLVKGEWKRGRKGEGAFE